VFIYIYLCFLKDGVIIQVELHLFVRWVMNNELESMWEEAAVAFACRNLEEP